MLLITVTAWCQEAKTVVLTKYTQSEGLSSYYVTKIIKDVYGFMWVGTQEGLNRFDGKTFQIFSKQSDPKHKLVSSYVGDLAEDTSGKLLWVLTSYAGINSIDINTRQVIHQITIGPDQKPLAEKWVRCLCIRNDTLWLGGLGILAAYNIKTRKWLNIDLSQKIGMLPGECNVSKITYDRYGRLWILSDGYGIAVLNKDLSLLHCFKNQLANGFNENRKLRFWDFAFQYNALYIATSWGLRQFTADSASVSYLPNRTQQLFDREEIQSIAFTSFNTLLFATNNRLCSLNLSTRQWYAWHDDNITDDWLSAVFQLFYDTKSQMVWIGAQRGLANFSDYRTGFIPFSRSFTSETTIKHAFSVLPANDTTTYVGDENGLYHVNTNTRAIEKIGNTSSNLLLFKDVANKIFASSKNGFFLIKDKKLTPAHLTFPALKILNNDLLSCAVQYNDSLILFGSIIQKGLTVWNTRSNTIKIYHKDSAQHPLKDLSIIDYLYRSKNGKAFILTEKSIIDFNPLTGAHATYTLNDSATGAMSNLMDMCETTHSYWIATYGSGLMETDKQFRVKKMITIKDGLNNNCVYRVFTFQDSLIIATTNSGLAVIDSKTHHIMNYFQSDGLQSDFFEQLCGYQSDRKIYAGGVNGFTIIEPDFFSSNIFAPTLYLNKITIETKSGTIDTSHIGIMEMTIPNDVLQTTISFSALNYSNPSRVVYAYKIPELNNEWIQLGNRNFINLVGLAPGQYTLMVKSANEDGIWNTTPLQVSLIYQPHWYQTLWFKLLILLTTAALIYAFVRYRISQIKKQQQIRKEIANDLHDDIGSTLNTVKIFTHLVRREPQNEDHLNQIEESLTQANLSLRDMIWVLDDNVDTIFELLERIKKFALPVCQVNNIQLACTFKGEKSNKPISKKEKRNLLLVAKEAINNSIKYADCKQIQVFARQDNNELYFSITDDGKGFEPDSIARGNGLSNMQYRADQIAYILQLRSTIGMGTVVELRKR